MFWSCLSYFRTFLLLPYKQVYKPRFSAPGILQYVWMVTHPSANCGPSCLTSAFLWKLRVSNTIANHYCDAILSSISLWTLSIPELRGKINKMFFRRKYPCSNYNFWWKILWQLQLLQYMFLLSDTCCCPAVPRVQIHEFYVQILKIEKNPFFKSLFSFLKQTKTSNLTNTKRGQQEYLPIK